MLRVYPHVAELLRTVLRDSPVVLEIGCGSKQYVGCFAGVYRGIDLQRSYGDGPGPGPDVLGDAQALPFADASVDGAFAVATLLIIPDTASVLSEVWRVLRPGGTFVVFDYSWWVARRLGRQDANHRHRFSSRRLARAMTAAGFRPRTNRTCVPIHGPLILRPLLSTSTVRWLTYLVSNWVVVSGRKT